MDTRTRPMLGSVLAIALFIIASSCGGEIDATPTSVAAAPPSSIASISTTTASPLFTRASDLEYADSRSLDVYTPTGQGPWPTVIVVHGLAQSRHQFAPLAEAIASGGAVVFNISTTFGVPPLDAIEDIACAVRFARAKASDFGGDPTSISIVGNSSGAAKGSIVAMDGDAYDSTGCVVSEGSALPDAFIGYEGPFDYATHLYGSFKVPQLQDEDPELWEAVNPYSHIGGNNDLVVRLIHGRDNDLGTYDVPPEVSTDFSDALAALGYDVEVTYLDETSHGALLSGHTEAFELTVQQVLDVASGDSVSSEAMTLTFGSTECIYEGPSVVSAGRANLTFINNSGATGAVNVIELLDDKTWEDVVEYAGEQPSSKHAPAWTRDVRQWRPIPSGETLLWEEQLTPGTYAMVCANTSPLAVWLGASFEVEG